MTNTFKYFIMYKPYGVLSQRDTKGYKKKIGLDEFYPFPKGVYPVGRLDEDSEGLLLMTSDNKMSIHIRSAKIEKEYWVQVDGIITDEAVKKLQSGVTITVDKIPYQTLQCDAHLLIDEPVLPERFPPSRAGRHRPGSWVSITLREGKFRQVRKMTAAVGFPTLRLVRARIGEMKIIDFKPGDVIELERFVL